ncbi:hypothetical protein THAOC_17426 [Thalassiosira oceanica]|uniref:Uncharacterized protein n=1 Tax=Thalassiosira oceanica TaxID=159749 RepID=K0S766_THAOC|nr:hypothetical protein THAOC_17426 [Thalassiosira oceanica]|eukprot:EJK61988.1 hypothetical protein THAOC_17426 [Thalassiosira oceanica]
MTRDPRSAARRMDALSAAGPDVLVKGQRFLVYSCNNQAIMKFPDDSIFVSGPTASIARSMNSTQVDGLENIHHSIPWKSFTMLVRQHPVGLGRLGRHNNNRERESSSSMASPGGGPTTAPMAPIHPQYIPYEKPVATEVRCGIELSPGSAACPSGTIYTSFRPDICAGLLSGTSAATLSVGLPFDFGFADRTTPLPG